MTAEMRDENKLKILLPARNAGDIVEQTFFSQKVIAHPTSIR